MFGSTRWRRARREATAQPLWSRRLRVLAAVLGGLVASALAVWLVVIPYPWTLRSSNPERTALMEQRIREARAQDLAFEIDQRWMPLGEVSPALVRAVIVAEDYRFRLHEGVDWVSLAEEVEWTGDDDFSWLSLSDLGALRRALAFAWANRSELRGRSTITQQLAKNLYFGTDRTLVRKAMELVVARRLERRLGKDRILELYLNVVEWGPGVFGAEAAARTYFGRSAASLTLDQAAALAGTLPHPLTSNPAYRPSRMLWRKDLILRRLDPSSGVPSAPLPLPEPDLDIGLEPELRIPAVELLPLGPIGSSGRADSSGAVGDPGPVDGAPPDSASGPQDADPAPDADLAEPSSDAPAAATEPTDPDPR